MWLKWDKQALPLLPVWLSIASLAYGVLWYINVVVLWILPTHFCERMCVSHFDRICRIYCAIYGCNRNSEFRSKCVTLSVRVRSSWVRGAVRVYRMSLRQLRVDQRRGPKPARPKAWINDRFTKPACHVDRTEYLSTYVTASVHHRWCDLSHALSLLWFEPATFYYYFLLLLLLCRGVLCYLTMLEEEEWCG